MTEAKLPKLCLNMIVRDEAHIIEETLESICKYIDYYIIVDTGSVDDTVNKIDNFFNSKGIEGEIFSIKWQDHFGYARTRALQLCYDKAEYIWIIDADDVIHGEVPIPPRFNKDCYHLKYGKGFTYPRTQIFKADSGTAYAYRGIRHEYPIAKKANATSATIEGNYYIDSRRLGARSNDKKKYLKDALAFERELNNYEGEWETMDEDFAEYLKEYHDGTDDERTVFYGAQSYFDAGEYEKAIEFYIKRIGMGKWFEEQFYSYYKIAECCKALKKPWEEIEKAYLDAYEFRKDRSEPLYEIAKHYREEENYKLAYKWAKQGSVIPYPHGHSLFVYSHVYDYDIHFELIDASFKLKKYKECYMACKQLLGKRLEAHQRNTINSYLNNSKEKLSLSDKENIVIYTGKKVIGENDYDFTKLINLLDVYDIYIVGEYVDVNCFPSMNILNITLEEFNKLKRVIKFAFGYIYDDISLLTNIGSFAGMKLALYQKSGFFNIYLNHGVKLNLLNQNYLNSLFKHLSKIICNDDLKNGLVKFYGLNPNLIYTFGETSDLSNLFNGIRNAYRVKIDNKLNIDNNGFDFVLPKYIDYLSKNGESLKKNHILLNRYYNIIKSLSGILKNAEVYYIQAKYFIKCGRFGDADKCIKDAFKVMKNENYTNDFKKLFDLLLTKIIVGSGKYEEAYQMCQKFMKNSKISEHIRAKFEKIRYKCTDKVKDKYLSYPEKIIDNMTNRLNSNSNNDDNKTDIVFSITTCKRFNLFEKTMNSFINTCTDINMIDRFICVDDNSSEKDRKKMQLKYPFFEFIFKDETQKGHFKSMNIIHNYVTENNVKYLLHMEDDFHFVEKKKYVSTAIKILENDDKLGQVLFNKNYMEVAPHNHDLETGGGIIKYTNDNEIRYMEHEHYDTESKEYSEYIQRNHGKGTHGYWPHYSFRPSVINCNVLRDLGLYSHVPHFEMQYAHEYTHRGYKSAFFDEFSCIHIGKKTWEKNGTNAYKLNETEQFTFKDNNIAIKVLVSDYKHLDLWKRFKEIAYKKLSAFETISKRNIEDIDKHMIRMFSQNNFSYRRDVISRVIRYLDIFRTCKSDYCLLIEEDSSICEDFDEVLRNSIDYMTENNTDMIMFGENDNSDFQEVKEIDSRQVSAYLLSRIGMRKISNYLMRQRLPDGDIYVAINPEMFNIFEYPGCTSRREDYRYTIEEPEDSGIVKYNGYKFYSQMDSHGNDVGYFGDKTLEEIKQMCDENDNMIAFNTSKWVKFKVVADEDLCHLYQSKEPCEGLYIKIEDEVEEEEDLLRAMISDIISKEDNDVILEYDDDISNEISELINDDEDGMIEDDDNNDIDNNESNNNGINSEDEDYEEEDKPVSTTKLGKLLDNLD